jgi:hypothetical protein
MSKAEHQRVRDMASQAWFPKEVAGLAAAQFMRAHLSRAHDATIKEFDRLTPVIRPTAQSLALANLRRGSK